MLPPIPGHRARSTRLLDAARTDPRPSTGLGLDRTSSRCYVFTSPGTPRISTACGLGAAWVLVRRSVASAEPGTSSPRCRRIRGCRRGLPRTTGETLMTPRDPVDEVAAARRPFHRSPGISHLGDTLATATPRGVRLEVILPTRSTHAGEAIRELG